MQLTTLIVIIAKNEKVIHNCRPNGAGKTTASYTVLPEILNCMEFVNADEIARGISPFNPKEVSIHAGRLVLKELINNYYFTSGDQCAIMIMDPAVPSMVGSLVE